MRKFVLALCALACVSLAPQVLAQAYPNRPIKLLVGFPAGGSTDLAARLLANRLAQGLGQPVVVENKVGASGNIASEAVAHAAPDGYTLMMAATSMAAAPAFFDKLPWDPVKDFTPVALVATVPILLVANPQLNVRNVADLVAYTKAHPGKVNMASPGPTTLVRLSGEQFKQTAKLDWLTVNYKGGAPAMQDLLAGTAQVMFAQISDVIGQVKAGKLVPLAVTTKARSAIVPDIPTLSESGYPGFGFATWQGVVGPAGLPPEVVARLNREIRRILAEPEMKSQFLAIGTDVSTGTPEEFGALIAEEVEKIRRIAKSVGATAGN